jgi:hypothetical protein
MVVEPLAQLKNWELKSVQVSPLVLVMPVLLARRDAPFLCLDTTPHSGKYLIRVGKHLIRAPERDFRYMAERSRENSIEISSRASDRAQVCG